MSSMLHPRRVELLMEREPRRQCAMKGLNLHRMTMKMHERTSWEQYAHSSWIVVLSEPCV
jgi:hypothetical protein